MRTRSTLIASDLFAMKAFDDLRSCPKMPDCWKYFCASSSVLLLADSTSLSIKLSSDCTGDDDPSRSEREKQKIDANNQYGLKCNVVARSASESDR